MVQTSLLLLMVSSVNLHPKQRDIVASKARYKVVRAGRRSGKTVLKIETLLFKAVSKANRQVFYIAPTQVQARQIIWEALKSRLGNIGVPSESHLEVRVPTIDKGTSIIKVGGWENRENHRGMPADHIEFDEVDTMKNFMSGFQEIYRPMLIDRKGTAGFGGTPKKENPNLRWLEKEFKARGEDFASFKFTSYDNPHIPKEEIDKARLEMDRLTFEQEILAEYVENAGALFHYEALVDIFTNTIIKKGEKYLIVDIADDGTDKTIFNFFEDLESYRIEEYERLNTESIISKIREYAAQERIPYSHIAVDAIGVGAGVASSSMLDGIIGYKSSYSAIKTDDNPVLLPNVHYTRKAPLTSDYKNLRTQCVFKLASLVNNHFLSCTVKSVTIKERIIEELSQYQDVGTGDGKRMATKKEDIKELLGRSPDLTDTFIMRMFFEIRNAMLPDQSEEATLIHNTLAQQFDITESRQELNSGR